MAEVGLCLTVRTKKGCIEVDNSDHSGQTDGLERARTVEHEVHHFDDSPFGFHVFAFSKEEGYALGSANLERETVDVDLPIFV